MSSQAQLTYTMIDGFRFPTFNLVRLLRTVFNINPKESFGVFIDLPNPDDLKGFAFLGKDGLEPQKHAYNILYKGLEESRETLDIEDIRIYAYKEVGGSNLDLPETVITALGEELPLREVLSRHTIVLYMGQWSATAPITALAKEMGFRGATMHGVNDTVIASGLSVDYEEVSARAERLRKAMTGAEKMTLEWTVEGETISLEILLDGQEAQKSHGLVRQDGEIANLPAGEVYFVPIGAEGLLPQKFDDPEGTVAVFNVSGGRIVGLHGIIKGDLAIAEERLARAEDDPNTGRITELGLGTQSLPFAGTDIQDEKIIGTAHVATGRSDHLGGDVDSSSFKNKKNATHDDILFTPGKTPELELTRVTMTRDGEETRILENYQPSPFISRFL